MIRIGIIGSGFGLYGLLPAFISIRGCRVVAMCGRKTDRLLSYCKKVGVSSIYTDWQEMLKKEDLDAIAIAVTPKVQYEIAKAAIKLGLHVFAEKPLASNHKEARELFILSKKHKTVTAVDFIFPEIKAWENVKSLIKKRTYGTLRHLAVDWSFLSFDIKNKIASWKTDVSQGGGALSFFFSHTLHYLEYFAGEINLIKGIIHHSKKSLNGGDVGADLLFTFKSGASGSAHLSCNTPGIMNHKLTFVFDEATVVLENTSDVTKSFVAKIFLPNGKMKILATKRQCILKEDERVDCVKKIAQRFIKSCETHTETSPSFLEGLRVSLLIERIRKQSSR